MSITSQSFVSPSLKHGSDVWLSDSGCFQPDVRSWKAGPVWLSPFVRLSGLVPRMYWTNSGANFSVEYHKGLVATCSIFKKSVPPECFFWGGGVVHPVREREENSFSSVSWLSFPPHTAIPDNSLADDSLSCTQWEKGRKRLVSFFASWLSFHLHTTIPDNSLGDDRYACYWRTTYQWSIVVHPVRQNKKSFTVDGYPHIA